MSFCTDVKNELIAKRPPKYGKPILLYGFALFGRSFSYQKIGLQTSSVQVADYYASLLRDVYNIEAVRESSNGVRPTHRVKVLSESDRLRVLASFDYGMTETAMNRAVFENRRAVELFLRGVFLACGSVSDPERSYRLDLAVREEKLARELWELLGEHGIEANFAKRGNAFTVYISNSEMMENFLALIGASDQCIGLIEASMIKELKNNINRKNNCDSGNISKTVEASLRQRNAIAKLSAANRLESLPRELYTVAVLRQKYPEVSLRELCRLSDEPISGSGMNHRLQRLIELAEELD